MATGITASGEPAVEGVTIAADWNVFPAYTRIEIEGMGRYIVHDKGGAIKQNRIDIYFDKHEDALVFGRRTIRIRVIEED